MLRKASGIGVLLVALLAVPRPSEAGLIEFIWELSGPQMIGGGFGCTFDTSGKRRDCRLASAASIVSETEPEDNGPFFFIGGEHTFSTGKNARHPETREVINYRFFRIHRLAVTPGVSFRNKWLLLGSARVYHAAAVSGELFLGADFSRFTKLGFALTPVEVIFDETGSSAVKLGAALKLRYYPHGFTPDEFGFGSRLDFDRPAEWSIGGAMSLVWFAR